MEPWPEEEDVTMMFCPLGCTCPCHTGKAFQQNEYDKQISNLLLQNDELRKALEAVCFPKGKAHESCRVCGAPSDWPHYPDGPCKALDPAKQEKRKDEPTKCCCDLVKAGHGGYCQVHG